MSVTRRRFLQAGGLSLSFFGFAGRLFSQKKGNVSAELMNMVSGVKPLEPEDFTRRQEKARALMAENNMDAVLLTGGSDLLYFTNVSWGRSERTFGVVIPRRGEAVWVCPAFERERALERIPKGREVRTWEEHESPYRLINGIMKDRKASGGRLGIGPEVRSFVRFGLREEAPRLEQVDGAAVTEGCRGVKSEKEIAYMDLANRITKTAYRYAFNRLRDGMSPGDMAQIVREAHRKMGVSGGGWPSFGENSAFPHGSLHVRNLKPGNIVLIDGGCGVEGYRSDVTRTIVFGEPSDKQRRVWDIVRKAQIEAIKAVRPGTACGEIDRVARKVIEDAGYGPGYKYFAHRLGHGIGMDGHEYPYLVKGNTLKMRPGMTFSNEPGIYIYGEFGVRIEDCFVVTEEGGRHLGGMESVSIEKPFG